MDRKKIWRNGIDAMARGARRDEKVEGIEESSLWARAVL
jgi:hypothetical protein